jgi:hypothetical protein
MTTGEVQKLQGVATATGIPIEALTKGMGFLDRNMANAAAGSKMPQIDDGCKSASRSTMAALRWRSWPLSPTNSKTWTTGRRRSRSPCSCSAERRELIPILNLGSQGIEQLNKKMEEYGVQNDDAIAKGVALAESVNETKLGFMGIQNVLTARWRRFSRSSSTISIR